jgi:predicted metalloprotease with PDZ domain
MIEVVQSARLAEYVSERMNNRTRFWLLLALLFFSSDSRRLSTAFLSAAPSRSMEMMLEHVAEGSQSRVRIEARFAGEASGKTTLRLPSHWAGQNELYKCIANLKVLSPGATLGDGAEPHRKLITHAAGQALHIQYELIQDDPKVLAPGRGAGYRPVVQPGWFHWIGHTAWVLPDWPLDEAASIALDWRKLPAGWSLASSFGANQRQQRFRASRHDFEHAVFVGGDFRVKRAAVRGKPVFVALRGPWNFTDDEFLALVARVVELEREFWRDFDYAHYLVTLLPLETRPGFRSIGGTGLHDSFASFVIPNVKLDDLKFLITHEYFHNWNTLGIGRMKEPEQLRYWFSEGFSDYYTWLLQLRGGLISLDDYVADFNQALREYYLSPVNTADNQRVQREFFSNGEIGRLPYWRGRFLAAAWNAEIKRKSDGKQSLDDAMRELHRVGRSRKNLEISEKTINEAVRRYTGADMLPQVAKHIDRGELIAPAPDSLGPCAELESVRVGAYELGFDLDALRAKSVIAGVQPGTAAYDAGLRDGQKALRRSIYVGDPTKPVELTIKDGEQEKAVKYLPVSRDQKMIPQFKLKAGLSQPQRDACLRWLAK